MVAVPVNKNVLKWARGERGLSREEAARLLKMTVADLEAIEERDDALPTLTQLKKMAARYQFPLHSFIMQELPTIGVVKIPDFRTIAGEPAAFDQKLTVALDSVRDQLELLADLKDEHPELFAVPPLRYYEISGNPRDAAQAERNAFPVKMSEQKDWASSAVAFRRWRALIEQSGIIVHVISMGKLNKCRGFSMIGENDVPVIVINGNESEAPTRSFSLFHEYYHLLTRKVGISDENQVNNVERRCNQFAAFFLMPEEHFVPVVRLHEDEGWTDHVLGQIADEFKVSMSAVAIHLEDTGFAQPGFYEGKVSEWEARKRPPKKKSTGPVLRYAERQVNRLGAGHVRLIMDAVDRGYVSEFDAYELIDVKPKFFAGLRTEIGHPTLNGGVG